MHPNPTYLPTFISAPHHFISIPPRKGPPPPPPTPPQKKKQSTQSEPALRWPWDSWPCPLLETTAGELALPLMGELTPALRKDGHSHPRLGRASSTLTLPEGGSSRGPE